MPNAPLDRAQLDVLCRLARLRLPPDGGAELARRLGKVVAAFADLAAVDTRDLDPSPPPPPGAMRADEPAAVLRQEQVLANSARTAAGCFVVPRVVEG